MEILIVVVILGILAAIVIPQFTSASTEAKESALVSDLQSVRSQIELYKIHHNDNLPGVANGSHVDNGGGGLGFIIAMTSKTNQDGVVGTSSTHRYGPYMQRIPVNPFNDSNDVDVGGTLGDDSAGWYFTTTGPDAGLFQADDDDVNPFDGNTPHSQY